MGSDLRHIFFNHDRCRLRLIFDLFAYLVMKSMYIVCINIIGLSSSLVNRNKIKLFEIVNYILPMRSMIVSASEDTSISSNSSEAM
jgi:hypothetical protein